MKIKLIKIEILKSEKFRKYIIIGILNTIISVIINYILLILGVSIVVAYILSYVFGGINGFIWNKIWVFGSNGKNKVLFAKYIMVNIFLIILGSELNRIISEKIGKYSAPVIVPFIIVILGFILNKKIVFREKIER